MRGRLFRSKNDVKICGVCGGLAEYFNIDPTIIRLLWAFLCLVFCPAAPAAYIIAAIIIPVEP
ncbi:MAG: PspC domain-containing protein [Clostridia bacterium]|nr:PspC domain-containing protein [Clostridia bacterium]